jgi:hypothetical protein
MLPFSADQFFAVFADYNRATWPAPVVAYLAGAAALAAALRGGGEWVGRGVAVALGAMWVWTGLAYHWAFFATVNPAAKAFALAFLAQGAGLLWVGGRRGGLRFGPPRSRGEVVTGLALVGYAAVLYPLLGRLAGHGWPAAPAFGVTPCPLTIFTFGVLLLTRGRVSPALLAIPALWSLIGGSAAFLLGVPQDWMLPAAGVAGAALLLTRHRRSTVADEGQAPVHPARSDRYARTEVPG